MKNFYSYFLMLIISFYIYPQPGTNDSTFNPTYLGFEMGCSYINFI
ncbi:hypothetical protein [Flavobacterium sp.]